jgi:hypothetical protein
MQELKDFYHLTYGIEEVIINENVLDFKIIHTTAGTKTQKSSFKYIITINKELFEREYYLSPTDLMPHSKDEAILGLHKKFIAEASEWFTGKILLKNITENYGRK